MPTLSLVLSILDNIQHHFMAISTLAISLPTLEDLIILVHAVPLPKKSARGSLADIRRDIYSYEAGSIRKLALVRAIPAR
jgi:hypothetical protein